jgi:hypothetical protein
MSDHHWLSEAPFERIQPPFPRSHGVPRGDDHRVVSEGPKPDRLVMDATHLKAHRTAASLAEEVALRVALGA